MSPAPARVCLILLQPRRIRLDHAIALQEEKTNLVCWHSSHERIGLVESGPQFGHN